MTIWLLSPGLHSLDLWTALWVFVRCCSWILALAIAMVAISVWLRNTIEMSGYQDENTISISIPKTLLAGLAFAMAALMILSGSPSVFLYFNF